MGSVLFFSRALDGRYLAAKAEEGRWQANISLAGSTAYLFGSTLFFEIPYNALPQRWRLSASKISKRLSGKGFSPMKKKWRMKRMIRRWLRSWQVCKSRWVL